MSLLRFQAVTSDWRPLPYGM